MKRPPSAAIYIGGSVKGGLIEGNTIIGPAAILHVEGDAEDLVVADNRHHPHAPPPVSATEMARLKSVLEAISAQFKAETGNPRADVDYLNQKLAEQGEDWRMRHVGGDDWELFRP